MADRTVDPELRPGLSVFPTVSFTDTPLAEIRKGNSAWAADAVPLPPGIAMEEHVAPGRGGASAVRFLLYRPVVASSPKPLFLFMHGGGYVAGKVENTSPFCAQIAAEAGCVVASVDYRLAPETRAPGQVEDCYTVLEAVHERAAEWQVDRGRIAVGGESAGAGLAAALALLARDRGAYPIVFQLLVSPMLDDRTCHAPDTATGRYVWTRDANRFCWTALLGEEPGGADVSPYAAAARAPDLVGLPPAYVSVGALDLFLDESVTYARRLLGAGVATELHVFPGAYHGFEYYAAAGVAKRAREEQIGALSRALNA